MRNSYSQSVVVRNPGLSIPRQKQGRAFWSHTEWASSISQLLRGPGHPYPHLEPGPLLGLMKQPARHSGVDTTSQFPTRPVQCPSCQLQGLLSLPLPLPAGEGTGRQTLQIEKNRGLITHHASPLEYPPPQLAISLC